MRLIPGVLLFLALAGPLSAADLAKLRADYLKIRDNSELFVGESAAWIKDEGDDLGQATAVATARARGSLAQAIEVRVQSVTEVESVGTAQGSTDTARQHDVASSDLRLASVKTQAFADFPKPGQVTVLAWLSKEEYRRQMKGKGPVVYRPENGVRLLIGNWFPLEGGLFPTTHFNEQKGFGLGLVWSHWTLEAMSNSNTFSVADTFKEIDLHSDLILLGYEWTPFAWRVQPYIPIGFGYANQQISLESGNAFASNYAAYVGAGARYWSTDSFALEFSVREYIPLNRVNGSPLRYRTKDDGMVATGLMKPVFELSGWGFALQVLWSAF